MTTGDQQRGIGWIAAGLVLVLLAQLFVAVPVVLGIALVAAGATVVTIDRWGGAVMFPWLALAHLAIYGALLALAVCARLDAGVRGEASAVLAAGDIVLAAPVMGSAILRMTTAIRNHGVEVR